MPSPTNLIQAVKGLSDQLECICNAIKNIAPPSGGPVLKPKYPQPPYGYTALIAFYDFSYPDAVYERPTGQLATINQPVGKVRDLSNNGYHFVSSFSERPERTVDGLRFKGGQYMSANNCNVTLDHNHIVEVELSELDYTGEYGILSTHPINFNAGYGDRWQLQFNKGVFSLRYGNSNAEAVSISVSQAERYKVKVCRFGGWWQINVNGAEVKKGSRIITVEGYRPLDIGRMVENGHYTNYLKGVVHKLSIYNSNA